ncbi:MAG: flagellar export chaperone FliS [Spirochaetia bacterium]|nr:flagellar export chaperone FliS [Spirochaetia bacterium]MDD5776129.1 flagellar export chaperone FliS [Treponema sp.]MCI6826889.1 flagellar export chaperone FliS [Spirochaetia bacterium]MCI7109799.1 flagellar export chaperone FliS [Spirochaetia bacterium]MCI7798420.1 flagellar export chaperone FliS [Spirochaetia bacterium]
MPINKGYAAYQNTNIKTASQGKLVVLLYEAAVKNLKNAESLIDEENKIKPSNMEKFGKFLQKAQAIITELQVSLDMEKGGEIAKNLMSLYIYFNQELISVNINHDKTKLEYIEQQMSELLKAWKEASASASQTPVQHTQALNIEG